MAYTDTWNAAFEALPANSDDVGDGAEVIRDFKLAVRERLAKDHYMNTTGTDADHGEHSKATLREQGSAPSNVASKGILYTANTASTTSLHFKDSANTVATIVSDGKLGLSTMNIVGNVGNFTTINTTNLVVTTENATTINTTTGILTTANIGTLNVTGTAVIAGASTLGAVVLNGALSGTYFKDEDTMASNLATAVASQQSIKAYVDNLVLTKYNSVPYTWVFGDGTDYELISVTTSYQNLHGLSLTYGTSPIPSATWVYVPSNAGTLRVRARYGVGANTGYIRAVVGTTYSNEESVTTSLSDVSLDIDCSALYGWYLLTIQLKASYAQTVRLYYFGSAWIS